MFRVRGGACITPLMLLASSALAQTLPGAPGTAAPSAGSSAGAATPQSAPQTLPATTSKDNLEQIVLTAQRRSETLQ